MVGHRFGQGRRRAGTSIGASLALAVAFIACGGSSTGGVRSTGVECATNDDCATGRVCVADACRERCQEDADCGGNDRCLSSPEGAACQPSDDEGAGGGGTGGDGPGDGGSPTTGGVDGFGGVIGGGAVPGGGGFIGSGAAPAGGIPGGGGFIATGGAPAGGAGGGSACGATAFSPDPPPLDLFVMFDQSTSMNDLVPGSAERWWDAAVRGLTAFVNDQTATGIGIGIQYFPFGGQIEPASCTAVYATPEVPIALLPGAATSIVDSLARHAPSGFTPTGPALRGALEYMKQWALTHPDRQHAVLLVTDGFPTECDPRQVSDIAEMARLAAESEPRIRTFVLGFSAGLTNLGSIATAGGTGQGLLIETGDVASQFNQGLASIARINLSCRAELPVPPPGMVLDVSRINLQFTPSSTGIVEAIPFVRTSGDCALNANQGWYFDDPTAPTEVLLCPGNCNRVATGNLGIVYGCNTLIGQL